MIDCVTASWCSMHGVVIRVAKKTTHFLCFCLLNCQSQIFLTFYFSHNKKRKATSTLCIGRTNMPRVEISTRELHSMQMDYDRLNERNIEFAALQKKYTVLEEECKRLKEENTKLVNVMLMLDTEKPAS
jgi:hypothetical protein